jgi:hypothetical protein
VDADEINDLVYLDLKTKKKKKLKNKKKKKLKKQKKEKNNKASALFYLFHPRPL